MVEFVRDHRPSLTLTTEPTRLRDDERVTMDTFEYVIGFYSV